MSIKLRGFSALCTEVCTEVLKKTERMHFFALGPMHLERLILIKKLLFIRSIMVLDDQILSWRIFVDRAMYHFDNQDGHIFNEEWSVVLHLLNTAEEFNGIDDICNMVERGHLYLKSV